MTVSDENSGQVIPIGGPTAVHEKSLGQVLARNLYKRSYQEPV